MQNERPSKQRVPIEAVMNELRGLPPEVGIGAAATIAYLHYYRKHSSQPRVPVSEIEAVLAETEVDTQASEVIALLRKVAIPGVSIGAIYSGRTLLRLTNKRGILPSDTLEKLAGQFPLVQRVLDYAAQQPIPQIGDQMRPTTIVQELAKLFLANRGTAIGSKGNNLKSSTNSYRIGATLRLVVRRLVQGEFTPGTDPGTYYALLLRKKPEDARYWSSRYYVGVEQDNPIFDVGSTIRLPNFAGQLLPFFVERVYEKTQEVPSE